MYSFARSKRLLTADDFQQVFKKHKRIRGLGFSCYLQLNDNMAARLGLAVSKKNIPLAVARNRIKRIIRESFRLCPSLRGMDVVIVVNRDCRTVSSQQLRQSLDKLWGSL